MVKETIASLKRKIKHLEERRCKLIEVIGWSNHPNWVSDTSHVELGEEIPVDDFLEDSDIVINAEEGVVESLDLVKAGDVVIGDEDDILDDNDDENDIFGDDDDDNEVEIDESEPDYGGDIGAGFDTGLNSFFDDGRNSVEWIEFEKHGILEVRQLESEIALLTSKLAYAYNVTLVQYDGELKNLDELKVILKFKKERLEHYQSNFNFSLHDRVKKVQAFKNYKNFSLEVYDLEQLILSTEESASIG